MKNMVLKLCSLMIFCSSSFAQGFPAVHVYKTSSNAVVLIIGQKDQKSTMIGAGSIITHDGYVVTNAHVVIDKSSMKPFSVIKVFTKPQKLTGEFQKDLIHKYDAKVVAYDTDLDLAILEVKGLSAHNDVIELANPDEINIGEEVVAIGHPEQGGLWSLTYGRISGVITNQADIPGKDVYQTDTSVNRGNSGGPLLDRRGYMVGLNTNIARVGADDLPITGVNFALKSSVVQKWLSGRGLFLAYGERALYEETKPAVVESGEKPFKDYNERKRTQPEETTPGMIIEQKPESRENGSVKTVVPVEKDMPAQKEAHPQGNTVTKSVDEIKKREKNNEDLLNEGKMPIIEEPEQMTADRILTPRRPYIIGDLFKEVEKEMEDIMEEMKWKIRKR